MTRRRFLHSALTTAAAVAASGTLGGHRAFAVAGAASADAGPAGGPAQPEWRSKGKWIIPTNKPTRFGLKVMEFNPIPAPDPATWTLQIGGLVEEPITLNAADIAKLPRLAQNSRLKCVQCWSGRVNWEGFGAKELLKPVRLKADAGWVRVDCADKYYDFVKLEDLFNPRTIFAIGMNGEAMPPEHGAPLRLVMPFKYGYKSSKLITKLTFLDKGGRGLVTDGMPYYSETGDILPGIDHPFEFPDEARKIKGGEIVGTERRLHWLAERGLLRMPKASRGAEAPGPPGPLAATRRQALQFLAACMADWALPRSLLAQHLQAKRAAVSTTGRTRPERRVIVVTFGGGVRFEDTLAPQGWVNIPQLAGEIVPQGLVYPRATYDGITGHFNSTGALVTGCRQEVDAYGSEAPVTPTMFELLRKEHGLPPEEAWVIATNKSFSLMGGSKLRDFGDPYSANVILPKQLLLETIKSAVSSDAGPGVEDRQALAERMMLALDEGYEGFGWRVFDSGRALGADLKASLAKSLLDYFNDPSVPTSGDELTCFMTKEIMNRLAPSLLVVNFWDIDIAHYGAYSLYLEAIRRTDRLVSELWQHANALPAYKDKTTLLVVPELGRDGDPSGNGFANHRSGDESCRRVWLVAIGAGVPKGAGTDRPIKTTDLAPTVARMLGFKMTECEGTALPELV